MAKFGIDTYDNAKFGNDPNLVRVDFSVQPFTATPLDYFTLQLTWSKPQATACTQLQLVRNTYNLPSNETDGRVLFSQDPSISLSLQDNDRDLSGFNYYSMFGWDGVNNLWIRSGDLIAMLPTNYMSWLEIYNVLPSMYRERDYILIPPVNPVQDVELAGGFALDVAGGPPSATQFQSSLPTLQSFFHLLGFQIDYLRSAIDSLLLINNPQYCSGVLLPYIAFQLGMLYEPDLGMGITRSLLSNAVHLYKLKGSVAGIEGFVSTLTGFGVLSVVMGTNRMLGHDDSVMSASLGTWSLSPITAAVGVIPAVNVGAVISQVPNLLAASPVTTDPTVNLGFIPGEARSWQYNFSGMKIVSGPACVVQLRTGKIPINDFLGADGTGYVTVSFQVWSPAVARQVLVYLTNESGVIIGASRSAGVTNPGHWVTATASFSVASNMGNYIVPNIQVASTVITSGYNQPLGASEVVYMTLVGCYQVNSGVLLLDYATTLDLLGPYDFPRDLKIILEPARSNLMGNPLTSMEQGIDGWVTAPLSVGNPAIAPPTAALYEEFVSSGDTSGLGAVYGVGGMTVTSLGYSDTVVYGGAVSSVVAEPVPAGWFTSDWFSGTTTVYTTSRTWFSDPGNTWFMETAGFFGLNPVTGSGVWFVDPPLTTTTHMLSFVPIKNVTYNFSVYVRSVSLSMTQVAAGIWWHFPDGTIEMSFGSDFTVGSDGFTRIFVSVQTPVNGSGLLADEMLGVVDFIGAPAYSEWFVNAAMLDTSPSLELYFDQSLYEGNADYIIDVFGDSYYYPNRLSKVTRLNALLPYFVPSGSTWSLVFSADTTVALIGVSAHLLDGGSSSTTGKIILDGGSSLTPRPMANIRYGGSSVR